MTRTHLISVAFAAFVLTTGGPAANANPSAPQPGTVSGEATPERPYKPEGTHDGRKAERADKRQAMAGANRAGLTDKGGDATPGKAHKPEGTHASRRAERAEKRRELADANRKGLTPEPGEAGVPQR